MRKLLGSTWRGASCLLLLAGCARSAPHAAAPAAPPPVVRLVPDPAYAGARISVVLPETGLDPAKCRYEWRRNGAIVFDAEAAALEPKDFARGDRITVRVTVPGAEGAASITASADVKIVNTTPRVRNVALELAAGSGVPTIQAHVDCVDADGDTPVLEYQWLRNDAPIEHAQGATLAAKGLTRGDRIALTVIAHDGESASPPVHSDLLTMENHPPVFTSEPAAPAAKADVYVYEAQASDPDGDVLHYELVNAPEGMSVTPEGEVRWELPTGEPRTGDHAVRLRASDGNGGEAVQSFVIRLGAPIAAR